MTLQHGQVSFAGVLVGADSQRDTDSDPDQQPMIGYIDFTPSRTTNYDSGSGIMTVILPITAGIDATGVLRDGQGQQTVTLVSTMSSDLLHQDWTWTARFRVVNAVIGPFVFNLAVGQYKNLADESNLMSLYLDPPIVLVDNGDGTMSVSGLTITDVGDGTFTAFNPNLVSFGDGTYSITY